MEHLLSAWGTTWLFPICLQYLHSIAKLFECLPVSCVYFHVTVREAESIYLHFPIAELKQVAHSKSPRKSEMELISSILD